MIVPGPLHSKDRTWRRRTTSLSIHGKQLSPCSFIHSASATRPPREDDREREEERPPTVHLPYAGVSERIRTMCNGFNIRAVFMSGPTLCSLLINLGVK